MTKVGFRLKSDRCHSPFSPPLNNVADVILVVDQSLNKALIELARPQLGVWQGEKKEGGRELIFYF